MNNLCSHKTSLSKVLRRPKLWCPPSLLPVHVYVCARVYACVRAHAHVYIHIHMQSVTFESKDFVSFLSDVLILTLIISCMQYYNFSFPSIIHCEHLTIQTSLRTFHTCVQEPPWLLRVSLKPPPPWSALCLCKVLTRILFF